MLSHPPEPRTTSPSAPYLCISPEAYPSAIPSSGSQTHLHIHIPPWQNRSLPLPARLAFFFFFFPIKVTRAQSQKSNRMEGIVKTAPFLTNCNTVPPSRDSSSGPSFATLSGLDVIWGLSDSSRYGLFPGEVVFGAVASPLGGRDTVLVVLVGFVFSTECLGILSFRNSSALKHTPNGPGGFGTPSGEDE